MKLMPTTKHRRFLYGTPHAAAARILALLTLLSSIACTQAWHPLQLNDCDAAVCYDDPLLLSLPAATATTSTATTTAPFPVTSASNDDPNNNHNHNSNPVVHSQSQSLPADPSLYEPVESYRLRNHITFNYETKSINEELCKNLDEGQCEEVDAAFRTNGLKAKQVAKANDGKIHTLCMLVKWEEENKPMLPKSGFETLWNGQGTNDDIPSGSVRHYIDINSYGKVAVEATIVDWITTNGTEEFYAGLPYISANQLDMRGAWTYVLEQLDNAGFDFSPFDVDNDGHLDSVVFIHSGYGGQKGSGRCVDEEGIDPPPSTTKRRITSHATAGENHKNWISTNGLYQLGNYAIDSAYRGRCTGNMARIDVLTHEFLHTFDLPDMYGHCGIWSGLGAYDMMAKNNGVTGRPAWPPMLSPWPKYKLGWSQPTEITEDGTYIARPSVYNDDIFIIKQGYAQNEYLLIEHRIPAEWEKDLWTQGILIYHIDENPPAGRTNRGWGWQDRGFPGLPFAEWPSSGEHYKVALLAADGDYDLEKCDNHGEAEDFYTEPSQVLGPGNGELIAERLHDGLYPNTDSYAYGNIVVTGISISNFRLLSSGSYAFDVSGLSTNNNAAPTNSPSQNPTQPPTLSPTLTLSNPPTRRPTGRPTLNPTQTPSTQPTRPPSFMPTENPSPFPSQLPSASPTKYPTQHWSQDPTSQPTIQPTNWPTSLPTNNPSETLSVAPIAAITTAPPTSQPTVMPSETPTATAAPSGDLPSQLPTSADEGLDPRDDGDDVAATLPPVVNIPTAQPISNLTSKPSVSSEPSMLPSISPTSSSAEPTILVALTESPEAVPTNSQSGNEPTSSARCCFSLGNVSFFTTLIAAIALLLWQDCLVC